MSLVVELLKLNCWWKNSSKVSARGQSVRGLILLKNTFCRLTHHTHSWWNLYKLFLLVFTFDSCFHNCLQRPEELRLSMPDQCHNVMNEKPEAQRGKALQCVSSVPLSSSGIKDKSKILTWLPCEEKQIMFSYFLIYNENSFREILKSVPSITE